MKSWFDPSRLRNRSTGSFVRGFFLWLLAFGLYALIPLALGARLRRRFQQFEQQRIATRKLLLFVFIFLRHRQDHIMPKPPTQTPPPSQTEYVGIICNSWAGLELDIDGTAWLIADVCSFSWWAAWLNTNRNKTVLAPSRWDNNAIVPINDLIPADWITLSW